MDRTDVPASGGTTQKKRRTAFFGAFVGHMIEWYDYGVYGFVAIYIGANFFSSGDPTTQILSTFAVFAVSFFVRPIGGLIFGPMADKIGRRNTLLLVLVMMTTSTVLVGLLPTYETIGPAAAFLLIALRVLQGLSAGGEVSTVTAFASEYATPGRRGFATSLIVTAAVAGLLVGALFANGLNAVLGTDAMEDWGWRLPFLVAGPLGAFALFIRLKIEDSPEFQSLKDQEKVAESPLRQVLRHPRQLVQVFCAITLLGSTLYLVMTYLTTYLQRTLELSSTSTFWYTIGAGVIALVSMPLSGLCSDLFARRQTYALLTVVYVGIVTVAFFVWAPGASAATLVPLVCLLALGFGLVGGWPYAMIAELLPTEIRSTGIAISYNLSIALFGGSAPFIASWLISETGNSSSPAFFFLLTAVVTGTGLLFTRDRDLLGVVVAPRRSTDEPAFDRDSIAPVGPNRGGN